MNILYIAELVGKAGIFALKKALPGLKERCKADFTIVCGDGATGGKGLGRNHAAYIRKLGADVITTGECCFYKKDLAENFDKIPYVLRPYNINPAAPGVGARVFKCAGAGGEKVAVAVLLGQSGQGRLQGSNPFAALAPLLERLNAETPYVVIDFHAWASGEKYILASEAAGRCTAFIGSHNRVQTADERISGGSAFICDAGRSGSADSVGGCDAETCIREYLSGIPEWTREAWDRVELQGLLVEADRQGRAVEVRRIKESVQAPESARRDPQGQGSPPEGASLED